MKSGSIGSAAGFCTVERRDVTWDPVDDFLAIQTVWFMGLLLALFLGALSALSMLPGKVPSWQRFVFLATAGRRGLWRELPDPVLPPDPVAEKALATLRQRVGLEVDPAHRAEWLAAANTVRKRQAMEAEYARDLRESERVVAEFNRDSRHMAWLMIIAGTLLSAVFLLKFVTGVLTEETTRFARWMRPARNVSLEAEPISFWFTMAVALAAGAFMAWMAIVGVRRLRSERPIDLSHPDDRGVRHEMAKILRRQP